MFSSTTPRLALLLALLVVVCVDYQFEYKCNSPNAYSEFLFGYYCLHARE